MANKDNLKQVKEIVMQLLKNKNISYDDWLLEKYQELIFSSTDEILNALKRNT